MEGSSFVFGDALVQDVFAFQVIPILCAGMLMPVKGWRGGGDVEWGRKAEADTCVHEVR